MELPLPKLGQPWAKHSELVLPVGTQETGFFLGLFLPGNLTRHIRVPLLLTGQESGAQLPENEGDRRFRIMCGICCYGYYMKQQAQQLPSYLQSAYCVLSVWWDFIPVTSNFGNTPPSKMSMLQGDVFNSSRITQQVCCKTRVNSCCLFQRSHFSK